MIALQISPRWWRNQRRGSLLRGREEGFEEGSELLVEDVIHAGHADHVQDEHPHSYAGGTG